MADYVSIQQGDLDDAAAVNVVSGHENLADYVGHGLDVDLDTSTSPETIYITSGKAFVILDIQHAPGSGHDMHDCLVTAYYDGDRSKDAVTDGVNYVWADFNMGTADSPRIEITDTDDAPSGDSLKIAEVDVTDEIVEETNRAPDGEYQNLAGDDFVVRETITWPDGATTETHPISYGETIDNRNDYYDEQADAPEGVVAQAADAQEADWAQTASSADEAGLADDSNHLEGYTADELLSEAETLRAQPWVPLFDEPYVNDSYDRRPEAEFDVSQFDYDYFRVRLQVENDSNYSDALGCYINGITDHVYNQINLLPRADYGERVVHRTGTDTWTVGSTMANSHSIHEFTISRPSPIVDDGPRYQFPVMNAAAQLTGGDIGSYQLSGNLVRDVDSIDEILIETGGGRLAIRAQVYGKMLFPEQYE